MKHLIIMNRFGLYIHVPFCRTKCTYCGFYRVTDLSYREKYIDSVVKELGERAELFKNKRLKSIYFGGGTPSVLHSSELKRIIGEVEKYWIVDEVEEFTVEVNPDDVTEDYLRELKEIGVNRISMGVQSFDDGILKWMNRRHTSAGVLEAFRLLRDAGFGNISIDLIFGLSQLGEEKWIETIRKALDLCPEHISAYQLSIEEGSALAGMVRDGRYTEAPEEQCRSQYDILCRELGKAEYNHYEISNFARPGFEAVHNSAYWKRLPYVGLGPGAHSLRLVPEQVRSWNGQTLDGWTRSGEILTDKEIREERIMLGLRTKEGVDGMSIPEDKWFVSDDIISNLI
mgnify:CR=1 FL=1